MVAKIVVAREAVAAARCSITSATRAALALARAISIPGRQPSNRGLDAIVVQRLGMRTMVKDYGFRLRTDPAYAEKAARIARWPADVSEVVAELGLGAPSRALPALRVAIIRLLAAAWPAGRARTPGLARRRRVCGGRACGDTCAAARPGPTTCAARAGFRAARA